jgi:orotidine-5'-phosphate decarboxylase
MTSIVFKRKGPDDEDRGQAASPVVLALDTADLDLALDWAELAGPAIGMVKVGLELFCAHGADAVRALRGEGHEVMLDLKLHDIPVTVARAVEEAAELDVRLVTVHAAGGRAMLEAAVGAAAGRVDVTAVTVLTSLAPPDLAALGQVDAAATAERLARLALLAGCQALVCSPLEAGRVRAAADQAAGGAGGRVRLVCPGIRLDTGAGGPDDQARVATPAEAVRAGADWLVVGRPITRAPDVAAAARAVLDDAVAAR